MGLVNCTFELERTNFRSDFIVCKNLTRPLILGRDFLIQNHVSVRYSENGKMHIRLSTTRIDSFS